MASRPVNQMPVITNGNMATNLQSLITVIPQLSMMSYGISWSGSSPIGTISVQVSNDYFVGANGKPSNPGTWTTITFNQNGAAVTQFSVNGNTGTGFLDIDQMGAYAIQLLYTASSGTGLLQVIFNGKVS